MSNTRIAKFGMGLLVGAMMLVGATSASALTQAEATAIITALGLSGSQAAVIQALVTPTSSTGSSTSYAFTKSLSLGVRDTEVMNLQKFLNTDSATQVSLSGAGSPGMETSYYGPATRAAVIKFQLKHGVISSVNSAGAGMVGPLTRASLNSMQSTSGGTGTTLPPGCTSTSGFSPSTGQPCNGSTGGNTQTGPVTAMLSSTNPASGVIIAGQATADLAHLTFSGSGTVTSVTLQRTGVSSNSTLERVYLYEGGMRLTDAASVASNGTVTFSNPSGLFTVSGSKTISVRSDILAGSAGQTAGVSLTSFVANGTTVTANVMGNTMSIAAATDLATVYVSGTNSVSASSVDAGTSNYTVWGETLSVGQRSVWLKGANFRVVGSIETGALQNARLIVDGAQVGTPVASVTANGTLSFDLSNAPVALTTGNHTVEVRADVAGGADRTFYVSLQNASDLMLTDSQYNVNLSLKTGNTTTAFTMNSAGTISVNSGTLSLAKDNSFNVSNVTSGATNVTIGKYTLRAFGEAVKVMQLQVSIDPTDDDGLQNIGIYVNGAQVASSQNDAAGAGAATLTYNLGSSLIVPAGQTVTVEVRADIIDATNAAYTGDIVTSLIVPVGQAQGQSSYALYPTGTALSVGSITVTATAATATVAKSSGFLTTTAGANASNVKVGSYVITAGTTEGLRVTNFAVGITLAAGAATTGPVELTDIANLKVAYTVQGQSMVTLNSVNPQATNNFSTDFTIPAGTSATVDVYTDVTNATAGETIETTLQATARGASSNVVLTGAGLNAALTGQTLTVGSGALLGTAGGGPLEGITVVSSTATSQRYVIGGSSVEPIIRYSVKPTSGAVTIEEMTFAIAGTTNAITALNVSGTSGGSSCSVQVPSGAATVTITGCSIPVPYTLGGTDLIVTPTLNTVGINGISSSTTTTATVDLTAVQYNNGTTSVDADLDAADDDDDLANTAVSNAIRPVASMPTLTLAQPGNFLTNGEVKVGSVTISASAGGNIKLETLPVTVTMSGGATLATTAGTDDIIIREGNNTIAATEAVAAVATPTSQAFVMTFTGTEIVTAGSSRTFDIYVKTVASVSGDDAAQLSLSPSSAFTWDDINGGGDNLVGTHILNYPTNSVTIND